MSFISFKLTEGKVSLPALLEREKPATSQGHLQIIGSVQEQRCVFPTAVQDNTSFREINGDSRRAISFLIKH